MGIDDLTADPATPSPGKRHWLPLLAALSLLAACANPGDSGDPTRLELPGEQFRIVFDLARGSLDVESSDDTLLLQRAHAELELGPPGQLQPQLVRSSEGYRCDGEVVDDEDELGACRRADIACSASAGMPELFLQLAVYPGQGFFTAGLRVHNPGPEPLPVARLVPLRVAADSQGGLFLGNHPANQRILEDGSLLLFEFFVDIRPGDTPRAAEADALGFVHGWQQGHSVSNWNHAIYDLDSGRALVAGSLDFELASPMCNVSFDEEAARPVRGRTPFTLWSVEYPLLPQGLTVPAGGDLVAGPVFVAPYSSEVLPALERYALAVKQYNGIELWPERAEENRVPTGWNSWTGSGSSGGYGADIDEQLMLDNLQAMDEEFSQFGGEWFQIDDGYEYYYGDWDWRPDRFPHGSAWLAQQIRDHGLIPGVWIAPFQVDENSQTYAEHAADGWFAERQPFVGGDKPILDLSRPDVQQWLADRFRRIRSDGFRWVKTDFVYWALGAASFSAGNVTREQAYRQGLEAIRRGLEQGAAAAGGNAGDTFWLSVSMIGPHLGYVDSIRPNLDTMPAWEQDAPDQSRVTAQGIKPTVRTMARRFYWQNRALLFNHDMLFFRAHADPGVPPLTADESRCLLAAVALSGSVAKLGEKIVEMEPEWIADYRKVIPVFGRAARPVDLFRREWPEVWHLHVVPEEGLNTPGRGPAYDVVALFNWGSNFDLTVNPYAEMADAARTVAVELEPLGIDPGAAYLAREFWSGEVLEVSDGVLLRTVQPHTVQVFALRRREERPQYLGGNRHLLQGAVEVLGLAWDDETRTLSLDYDAAAGSARAPFIHRLYFHLPAGWELEQAGAAGVAPADLRASTSGGILEVSFTVPERRSVSLALSFRRS